MSTELKQEPTAKDQIVCHIDNKKVHSVQNHIKQNHSDEWTVERYKKEFPDAPLLSEFAKLRLEKSREIKAREQAAMKQKTEVAAPVAAALSTGLDTLLSTPLKPELAQFHEVFDLGNAPESRNKKGNPISVNVMTGHDATALDYLPDIDQNYVFNIDLLKKIIIGLQLNMPTYLWGFHGTGKTTILQQANARLMRSFMRVQHTINMQESDITGQWTVRDGSTEFQLGPLPLCMLNGWTYCADEYDFAMPSVTAVYQPVLEGQSLLIKDAPKMWRKIEPHPNFRFCATGNTNGIGDETGLYQGTLMQNAANYSRFRITEEVQYMDKEIETSIIMARADLRKPEAERIVKFANDVRELFRSGKISMTISPREIITAAQLGRAYGGDYTTGLKLAFANRCSRVDKETLSQYLQRTFD